MGGGSVRNWKWNHMKAYRSINPYSVQAITALGLAYGLADTPFTFASYAIYTFLFTLKS